MKCLSYIEEARCLKVNSLCQKAKDKDRSARNFVSRYKPPNEEATERTESVIK